MQQIIPLGGAIQKDQAFQSMNESWIYDSVGLRCISSDGGTTGNRENIRGTTSVLAIPDIANKVKISSPTGMVEGGKYEFLITVNDGTTYITIGDTDPAPFIIFTTYENWITDLLFILQNLPAKPSTWEFNSELNGFSSYIIFQTSDNTGVLNVDISCISTSINIPILNSDFSLHNGVTLDNWNCNSASNTGLPTVSYYSNQASIHKVANEEAILSQSLNYLPSGDYTISLDVSNSSGTTPDITVYLEGYILGAANIIAGNQTLTFTNLLPSPSTSPQFQIIVSGVNTLFWNTDDFLIDNVILAQNNPIIQIPINNSFIPSQTNLKVIGWTSLRDSIYLFTTSYTYSTSNSNGQIWSFTYKKNTDITLPSTYTLELKYSGALNFSTSHPIPNPGGIISRYQNSTIQPIYWTDYFNLLRVANVANPLLYSLSPEDFQLFPSTNFTIPQLEEITQTGNIQFGSYQYAYRLFRKNGSQTQFSLPTQEYILTLDKDDTSTIQEFHGPVPTIPSNGIPRTVSKTMHFKIEDLDTNYDFIEVITIYKQFPNSTPEITIIKSESISHDGTYKFTHDGGEKETIPISIDEYNKAALIITKVKSIESKSNTLFLSNVSISKFNPTFDARTYRFPSNSSTTNIYDHRRDKWRLDSTDWEITHKNDLPVLIEDVVPLEHDCIQDYDSQSPLSNLNNLYLPSSNTLGGQGPNISYTFLTDFTENTLTLDTNDISSLLVSSPPHLNVSKNSKSYNLEDNYFHISKNMFEDWRSPMTLDLFQSYMRDEMYRLGVVFFDNYGNSSFVKWSADIRFPHAYMPVDTDKHNRLLQTKLFEESSGRLVHKPLGIRFTVDISSIADQISAFSIVRCPLEDTDKHILGQGVFTPSMYDDRLAQGNFLVNNFGLNTITNDAKGSNNFNVFSDEFATIRCPDFIYKSFPGSTSSDEIDFIGLYSANLNSTYNYDISQTGQSASDPTLILGRVDKYYQQLQGLSPITDTSSNNPYQIVETLSVSKGERDIEFASSTVKFFNITNSGNFINPFTSIGGESLLLKYNGNPNFTSTLGDYSGATKDQWQLNKKVYVVNYKRRLSSQYGGNSYADRSNSEYIYCNNYIRVEHTDTEKSIQVYGGDVTLQVWDFVSEFINPDVAFRRHRIMFVPLETRVNLSMREYDGTKDKGTPNREYLNSTNSSTLATGINTSETQVCNPLFTPQHSSKTFFSLPSINEVNTEYDVRTYKSFPKDPEEVIDSWSQVQTESFLDAEAEYGPITNLIKFKDKIFFIQEKAVGVFQIAEKAVVQGLQDPDNTGELVLGSSGILERFDYLSTKTGSKHQFSFSVSDNSFIFWDSIGRKMMKFSNSLSPISDIKGMNSFFYNNISGIIQERDNPYLSTGIHSTYDYRYNEFLTTFSQGAINYTVVYNELLDGFTGFYPFHPTVYINDKTNIFSMNNTRLGDVIYLHNYGDYGVFYDNIIPEPSSLTFVVNSYPELEKVLNNLEFEINCFKSSTDKTSNMFSPLAYQDFISTIEIWGNYQYTGRVPALNISKKAKTIWKTKVPSSITLDSSINIFDPSNQDIDPITLLPNPQAKTQRFKDTFFLCKITYSNTLNNKIIMNSAKALFTVNVR